MLRIRNLLVLAIALCLGSCGHGDVADKWPLTIHQGLAWSKLFVPMDAIEAGSPPSGGRPLPLLTWNPKQFPEMRSDAVGHHVGYWVEIPALESGFYEIGIDFVTSAYEAFLFPLGHPERTIFFEVGHPGAHRQGEIPFIKKRIVPFQVLQGERWVLVMNVSNYNRTKGGLWRAPQVAPQGVLQQRHDLRAYLEFGLAGSMLIMFCYTFMMFLRRRADIPALLLSCTCLAICMRMIGIDNLMSHFFLNVDTSLAYRVSVKLEYISMALILVILLQFLESTFPRVRSEEWIVRSLQTFNFALIAFALLAPPILFTRFVTAYQASVVLSVIYMLVFSIRALRSKEDGIGYMFTCLVVLFVAGVADVVNSARGSSFYISHFAGVVFVFMQSQVLAKRFAEAYRKAEHLSIHLQEEVEHQTLQIRNIMDNVPEGLFTIGSDLKIRGQCSKFVYTIFNMASRDLDNLNDLLLHHTEADRTSIDMSESVLLAVLGEDEINWSLNCDHLLRETLTSDGRSIEFEWHPIVKEDVVAEILVIVRDITELKDLRQKTEHQEREIILLSELARAKNLRLMSFLSQTNEIVKTIHITWQNRDGDTDQSYIRLVLALLHTLKGNSRQIGFSMLSRIVHEFEQNIIDLQKTHGELNADFGMVIGLGLSAILEHLGQINDLHRRYWDEIEAEKTIFHPEDLRKLQTWVEGNSNNDVAIKELIRSRMNAVLKEQVLEMRAELYRLANDLGKAPPRLHLDLPDDLWINEEAKNVLLNALGHIFRNSMDHGIEMPDERELGGKEICGQIDVFVAMIDGALRVTIADDGRGLDLDRIQEKAHAFGIWRKDMTLSEKLNLVFLPGFSTAQKVSQISGRGIGMDAVQQEVATIGGHIHIQAREAYAGALPRFVPFLIVMEFPQNRLGGMAS